MDNITFLKESKALLRGVIRQRNALLRQRAGYIESEYARNEMKNIEQAVSRIVSAHQMLQYLQRKELAINYLIPTSNNNRKIKLKELLSHCLANHTEEAPAFTEPVTAATETVDYCSNCGGSGRIPVGLNERLLEHIDCPKCKGSGIPLRLRSVTSWEEFYQPWKKELYCEKPV